MYEAQRKVILGLGIVVFSGFKYSSLGLKIGEENDIVLQEI